METKTNMKNETGIFLYFSVKDSCQATELTFYPDPDPNDADIDDLIEKAEAKTLTEVNLNNVSKVTKDQWKRLFLALPFCSELKRLSLANCGLTDTDCAVLAQAVAQGAAAPKGEVTLDSNLFSATAVVSLLRAAAKGAAVRGGKGIRVLRISNQVYTVEYLILL